MKQYALFNNQVEEEKKYTSKIEAPVYEPKNKKPFVMELFDNSKTKRLIREIKKAKISDEEKDFLIKAAERHTVFNYEKIANFYAHSPKEVQRLMERSALVIIDFESAIQNGYVQLSEEIKSQYLQEYGE